MKELELKSYLFEIRCLFHETGRRMKRGSLILSGAEELIAKLKADPAFEQGRSEISIKFLFGELNTYEHENSVSEGQMSLFDNGRFGAVYGDCGKRKGSSNGSEIASYSGAD